ncbi:hypothetical protein SDC9_173727 [bioreactor metagenome]|uniref:Uncharacterized protein n=1 Tax=bioreactor metagenome TaxID=1076179 RepID=A0A645GRP7_9ZZZZ
MRRFHYQNKNLVNYFSCFGIGNIAVSSLKSFYLGGITAVNTAKYIIGNRNRLAATHPNDANSAFT